MREVRFGSIHGAAWDSFAILGGGSLNAAYGQLRVLKLKSVLLRNRLRVFELFSDDGLSRKIGQCALVQRRRCFDFVDRIQLLPEFDGLWPAAMGSILSQLGAGDYTYGSQWCLDEPRQDALAGLAGVSVRSVRPIVVQGVDFSRWGSWDAYWKEVSNNSRRDFAKAQKAYPDLKLVTLTGRSAIKGSIARVRERAAMYQRKGLSFNSYRGLFFFISSAIFCPHENFLALLMADGRILSMFHGFQFGGTTYYIAGATGPGLNGAGWYLQLSLIKRAYDRNPGGKFLVGHVDYTTHDEVAGGGLLRSRRAIRVSDWPGSIVGFSYVPP